MKVQKVSVILPCYNGARWIGKAIQSVLAQTFEDLELVIVDDGSTDNSRDTIASYLSDGRVRYIFQENRGFSGANNTGIKESKGELIGFIGQDDLWTPNKLKVQVEYMDKYKNIDLVHSDLYHIDSNGRIIKRRNPKVPKTVSHKENVKELFLGNFICIQTAIVRRICFEDVGLFDEKMVAFSDHDLWLRMAGNLNIGYIKKPLVKKRYHRNRLTEARREATIKDEFLIIKKAVSQYPFLKKHMRNALSKRYYVWGLFLLDQGEKKDSRGKLLKAVKYDPYNFKALVAYAAPTLYKLITNLKARHN